MFDNGSFLRRRKRYKRTSLTHGVPFSAAVFSPFSPFWVRKPVPVLPVQFGGFSGFQDNFGDVFASAAASAAANTNCFRGESNRSGTSAAALNANAYRDEMVKPEVTYDSRAKMEFLKRNMDAFKRNLTSMDLIARNINNHSSGASSNTPANGGIVKTVDFQQLNENAMLINKQLTNRMNNNQLRLSNSSRAGGASGSDAIAMDHCDNPDAAIDFFCYDGNDDLDASNDKIDVENESEEFCVDNGEDIEHTVNGTKVKSVGKSFLNMCKSSFINSNEREGCGNKPVSAAAIFANDLLLKNEVKRRDSSSDKLSYGVYDDMSPDQNAFSSRCSNGSGDFEIASDVGGGADKQLNDQHNLWHNSSNSLHSSSNNNGNKKCFESTVLDYDFLNKKRKYGNTKGFSIDNLIGRTVDET